MASGTATILPIFRVPLTCRIWPPSLRLAVSFCRGGGCFSSSVVPPFLFFFYCFPRAGPNRFPSLFLLQGVLEVIAEGLGVDVSDLDFANIVFYVGSDIPIAKEFNVGYAELSRSDVRGELDFVSSDRASSSIAPLLSVSRCAFDLRAR